MSQAPMQIFISANDKLCLYSSISTALLWLLQAFQLNGPLQTTSSECWTAAELKKVKGWMYDYANRHNENKEHKNVPVLLGGRGYQFPYCLLISEPHHPPQLLGTKALLEALKTWHSIPVTIENIICILMYSWF